MIWALVNLPGPKMTIGSFSHLVVTVIFCGVPDGPPMYRTLINPTEAPDTQLSALASSGFLRLTGQLVPLCTRIGEPPPKDMPCFTGTWASPVQRSLIIGNGTILCQFNSLRRGTSSSPDQENGNLPFRFFFSPSSFPGSSLPFLFSRFFFLPPSSPWATAE